MARMFLVVKGNHREADLQAKLRGIDLSVDVQSIEFNECYCYAPIADRPKIVGWFCEDQDMDQPGKCLWFTERPD